MDFIKEAVRGSHHRDYTKGPIGRSIFLLAIPMVLEMLMESVFAVVDIFWVAHLGKDAAATVGLTESLLTLIYALAIGLSIGATATVARRIGERNPDGAARAAVQAILIALFLSIVIAAIEPRLLETAGFNGWVTLGHRTRILIYRRYVGGQRNSGNAVHGQCDLSRFRRRCHCDADAVAGELDQHHSGPVFDFWSWAISQVRDSWCGDRN